MNTRSKAQKLQALRPSRDTIPADPSTEEFKRDVQQLKKYQQMTSNQQRLMNCMRQKQQLNRQTLQFYRLLTQSRKRRRESVMVQNIAQQMLKEQELIRQRQREQQEQERRERQQQQIQRQREIERDREREIQQQGQNQVQRNNLNGHRRNDVDILISVFDSTDDQSGIITQIPNERLSIQNRNVNEQQNISRTRDPVIIVDHEQQLPQLL